MIAHSGLELQHVHLLLRCTKTVSFKRERKITGFSCSSSKRNGLKEQHKQSFALNYPIHAEDVCFIRHPPFFIFLPFPFLTFRYRGSKWKYQMTFSCLSSSLCFSTFCCLLKIELPNHQRSSATGPVGTGFSKRVPEMSLINSLRGREREMLWGVRKRKRERNRGRGWVNNDRDGEGKGWSGAKRKRWGRRERGVDNENEGSETEKEEARQGLWGKDVVVNKAEEEWWRGALIRHRTKAPSHFTWGERRNGREKEWR